jgi:hypothetical protein
MLDPKDCPWCKGEGYLGFRHCGADDCFHVDANGYCLRCDGTGEIKLTDLSGGGTGRG